MNNTELIREYLENNQLEDENIKQLALKIGVSHSAISRFVLKAGFASFKEMKRHYLKRDSLANNALIYNDGNYLFSLSKLVRNLDYHKLLMAAKMILKKQKIILVGKIFSEQIVNYFYTLLRKINLPVIKYNSASEIDIITPEQNAVFIFISFSGRNQDLKRILLKIKNQSTNSAFLLLTLNDKSALSPLMNETICGYAYQDYLDHYKMPLISYTMMSILVNMLFERIYMENKAKNELIIKNFDK